MRPDSIHYLTGKLSDRPYPSGISLPGEGGKFTTNGEIQRWAGNTFVCHVTRPSMSYSVLVELQEEIKRSEFSILFTWLPAPSFHMTVFQGLSPGNQGTDNWPADLAANATRDEATSLLIERVADLDLDSHFQMQAVNLFCAHSLTVCGVDDSADGRLRDARRKLRAATRISPPNFDGYVFHITLGYLIQWLSESCAIELIDFSNNLFTEFSDDLQVIELEPCALCNFETMHNFAPVKLFG